MLIAEERRLLQASLETGLADKNASLFIQNLNPLRLVGIIQNGCVWLFISGSIVKKVDAFHCFCFLSNIDFGLYALG